MKYICMVITVGWHCNRKAFCLFTENKETDEQSGQRDKDKLK